MQEKELFFRLPAWIDYLEQRFELLTTTLNEYLKCDIPMPRNFPLSSKGCVLCHQGAKMVLFVTGLCGKDCWYCPLSRERRGKDIVFANEHPVCSPEEILEEADAMSALGTGITGGEPLLVIDRVIDYCRLLKDRFGDEHQIHLYTARAPDETELQALRGHVDEIRLHPSPECWDYLLSTGYAISARRAKELGFDIGIEVPALPGIERLIPALSVVDFLNINELEWGETNADEMRRRGLELEDRMHNAIRGAREWARDLCMKEKVHWCSSRFKDSVQLRERLKRTARNTARPFDEITEDGTIVYGEIELQDDPGAITSFLKEGSFEVLPGRIELSWWILAEEGERLPGEKRIIERYPNNGMIVEVTPL
jgi:pyruvate formate-lyase activating enzyme-like uncharacterized protein